MANDFSADSNCISVYRTESGALGTDAKGSQALTSLGGGPSEDTTIFKEGACAARFVAASAYGMYRTDANLSASFPLKSGTSNTTISVCAWVYQDSVGADGDVRSIASKFESGTGAHRTFRALVATVGTSGRARLTSGDTGGNNSTTATHASDLAIQTWFHITCGYRDSDKAYRVFVRDASGNTVGSDVSGTATANIALFAQSDFMVGCQGEHTSQQSPFDGRIDEVVIFSKLLTATDATNIAKGLYSGTGDGGGPLPSVNDTATLTEDIKMHMPLYVPMMKF